MLDPGGKAVRHGCAHIFAKRALPNAQALGDAEAFRQPVQAALREL
jgi:hypothetical protein